jgi:hypothetical protein
MTKNNKLTILFLVQILLVQNIYGQGTSGMKDFLSQKFLNFTAIVPREEIYIHSDRNEYISGEDMWFKIYLVDRQKMKPSGESKIAYFELLNSVNRPVVQKKIYLENGSGPGQIVLPDTLSTGTYTIRAYTSWMKNFLPDNCFSKSIHIYNAFSTRSLVEKKISAAPGQDMESSQYLPAAAKSGLVLTTDNLKPDVLEIMISADEKYRSDNNNLVYLFIQTHGVIDYVSTERIVSRNLKIVIPKNQLTSGINQITVFNLKGEAVGERYIYTPDQMGMKLSVSSPDSSGLRKKISVEFGTGKKNNGKTGSSAYSISVTPLSKNNSAPDINEYLVTGTEFGPDINRILTGRNIAEVPADEIDNLLRFVHSNWINWTAIVTDEVPVISYPMEKEDHYLSGRLSGGDPTKPKSDNFVLLSVPGKIPVFQYGRTDNNGRFSFRLHIDEKIKDLVVVPDVIIKNQSLNIESPFSDKYSKIGGTADSVSKVMPDYISDMSVNHQVRKIYGSSAVGSMLTPVIPLPQVKRFYGKPDAEIKMKDYILLPVMQEVFFELLPGTFLKTKKDGYEITVTNPENNKPYTSPPGLFIDGVAIKDASLIANLETEIVEKIDVVSQKYYVGDYLFSGIVNVTTKSGDFNNIVLPDYAVRMSYKVIDPVPSFTSPEYGATDKGKHIPDFRNTLYWNPSVITDDSEKAGVNFWTSDFISDFVVNIQGFTADGKPVSVKKIIKVRK